jgi:hypothetical protein
VATRLKPSPTVVYLYGVTAKPVSGLAVAGMDGKAPVESIACAGLLCWVSHVPQLEFADNLAKNMENMDWLSEAGVCHQRVVSAIAASADILPARFGTVFLDLSSLQADVRKRQKLLVSDLRKINGCEEWGVKVFGVKPAVKLPAKKPASGREYLKSKALLLRKPSPGVMVEGLQSFSSALRRISEEIAEGGRISGGQQGLQWQSSLLMKRGNQKKLEAALKKYSAKWSDSARIECTGPWPPYSFVSRK